jgi:glycosyltransferase involved in cell wall biosynthesis
MKVSVAIAAYNAAETIGATLNSVLRQTVLPDETLVVNDGSTDNTASILHSYNSQITVLDQENKGLSAARNVLCKQAQGDLIAFLDADDIWHPRYLEVQRMLFKDYPNAVAFFTGHVNFSGNESFQWDSYKHPVEIYSKTELLAPEKFLRRYSKATGPFASPSYCCVPKRVLSQIGPEPFDASVRVCDDAYLFYSLALLGPVVYCAAPLAAYRITERSLSYNRVRNLQFGVYVFELLEECYKNSANKSLFRAFRKAFASKRREYAKVLMGLGNVSKARSQLRYSLSDTISPDSLAKSLALSFLSYMPAQLQPTWPPARR